MRAAIFEAVGEPMIITDVQIAEPVGLEVLVKNAAAGLCHSDLLFMEGSWPHPTPTILGHEVADDVAQPDRRGTRALGEGPADPVPGERAQELAVEARRAGIESRRLDGRNGARELLHREPRTASRDA